MKEAEVLLELGNLSSEIITSEIEFWEYIEDYFNNNEEYGIDPDSTYLLALEYSLENKDKMFNKYINYYMK